MKGAGRGLLGGLDDDRAAGRQRARDLAARLAHREIPGREGSDRADRLVHHDIADAGLARDDAAIGALALGRIPFEELAAPDHFEPGLRQRLAVFQRDRMGDLLDALAHQRGRLEHDLGTNARGHAAPDLEALARGRQRIVEVGLGGERHRADDALVGRIEHGLLLRRLPPGAADIELEIGIGRHGSLGWRCVQRSLRGVYAGLMGTIGGGSFCDPVG